MCSSIRFTLIVLMIASTATAMAQESAESKKKAWFDQVLSDRAFSSGTNPQDMNVEVDPNSSDDGLPPVFIVRPKETRTQDLDSSFTKVDSAIGEPQGNDGEFQPVIELQAEAQAEQYAPSPQRLPPSDFAASQPADASVAQPRPQVFEPLAAEPQMLAASHQIVNTGREMLDVGRAVIDAQPTTTADGSEAKPALSNYYGHVTVNYYVSPEGKQPVVRPASFQQDMDPFADDEVVSELLAPPIGAYPGHGPYVPCNCIPCCKPLQSHCLGAFGEALYMRPGNLDIIYATEQMGCDPATATPTGPLGIANMDSEPGFRAGFNIPLSSCASLVATYTWLQADTNSSIAAQNGAVLGSRVLHPSIENCGINSTSASAKFDVDFQMMDLDYRRLLWRDCDWGVNYIAGVRYGRLTQEFQSDQIAGSAVGLATVTSDIDFDGVGIRLGLDGERHSSHTGMFIYGRGVVNMLGGEYKAKYLQTNQFDPTANIGIQYEDYRLSTILEGELGVGWQSCAGHVRLSLGYQGMGWYNALLTGAFIDGIANNGQFTETNDDFVTFDGLVGRIEFRK